MFSDDLGDMGYFGDTPLLGYLGQTSIDPPPLELEKAPQQRTPSVLDPDSSALKAILPLTAADSAWAREVKAQALAQARKQAGGRKFPWFAVGGVAVVGLAAFFAWRNWPTRAR